MIHVLVVEDSPTQAKKVAVVLREAGFDVDIAGRLAEAIERLAQGDLDVLLLDLTLPDSEGLDTFMRVRAEAPSIPTVVLTGLDEESLAASALRNGAQDYLVKGQVTNDWLVRSLRYAVERHHASTADLAPSKTAKPPKPLDLSIEEKNGVTLVFFREKRLVDDVQIEQADLRIARLVESGQCDKLILDFSEVEYLSNVALGMLVKLLKKIRSTDNMLRLCEIRPQLKEHFVVRRLDKIFDIQPDISSALENF